jgi:hypothetical protein
MPKFGDEVVINLFKNYNTIMGSCIKTYVLCERKKKEIINSRSYILSSDSHKLDGELCKAYTYAQNEIFREFLFLDLMYREIKSIKDGVVKTKTTTKKLRKMIEGGKRKKPIKKSKRNKTEHFTGGGGLSLDKLKKTISLFLLFALKGHAENSDVAVFQDRFDTNILALDPLNEEQMQDYTRRFGSLQSENYKVIKSANLLEKFHDKEEYYLYHSNTSDFHKDVRKQVFSLFNDNVYPVYERLLTICDVFIDQTTDTNPAEYGKLYSELSDKQNHEYKKKRLDYEQALNDDREKHAVVRTKAPDSFWSKPKKMSNIKVLKGDVEPEKSSIILISSSNLLDNFDKDHNNRISQTIHNEDEQHMLALNRQKYLSGICRFSLKTPSLEYDENDGTITFNDFQKYRSNIDVIIRSVKAEAIRDKMREQEFESFEDKKRNESNIAKQIEMAVFLQEALLTWDSTFRDVVINGHSGKKSMAEFGKKFKYEMETLNKFLRLGLKGNPIALRKAIQQRNDAMNKKEINNITMEGKKMDSEIQDEVNAYDNEETAKYWKQFTYVNTAFLSETSTYILSGVGTFAKQSLYDTAVALSIPASMLAATLFFLRLCWYKKINNNSNDNYNNNNYNNNNYNNNNNIGPVVPLQLTYIDREKNKNKQAEILAIRSNTLRERLLNGECPEGYKYVSRLKNCMPKEYSAEGKMRDNYVNWYFNRKEKMPYDKERIYETQYTNSYPLSHT